MKPQPIDSYYANTPNTYPFHVGSAKPYLQPQLGFLDWTNEPRDSVSFSGRKTAPPKKKGGKAKKSKKTANSDSPSNGVASRTGSTRSFFSNLLGGFASQSSSIGWGVISGVSHAVVGIFEMAQKAILWTMVMGASFLPKWWVFDRLRKFLQHRVIFQPIRGVDKWALQDENLFHKIQSVDFKSHDGTRLHGWYIPPRAGKPVVVLAHGIKFNIQSFEPLYKIMSERGYGVFAADYRGFGNSANKKLTESGVTDDLHASSEYVSQYLNVPYNQQILMGYSLGGGVVSNIAKKHPYRAVVIVSSFDKFNQVITKLREKAPGWLKWLYPERFEAVKFDSIKKLQGLKSPLLVVHGDKDDFVDYSLGRNLFNKVKIHNIKSFCTLPGAKHELTPDDLPRAMDALEHLLAQSSRTKRKAG